MVPSLHGKQVPGSKTSQTEGLACSSHVSLNCKLPLGLCLTINLGTGDLSRVSSPYMYIHCS